MQKVTESLLDTCNEFGLEVNPEKTKYTRMSMLRYNKSRQRRDKNIANKSFEDVAKFKSLSTLTDQNFMYEEIKSRIIPWTASTIRSRLCCLSAYCVGV
jgi:hypothetical protein